MIPGASRTLDTTGNSCASRMWQGPSSFRVLEMIVGLLYPSEVILWMEEILHQLTIVRYLWNTVNRVNYQGINHVPTGAGFLPSTVWSEFESSDCKACMLALLLVRFPRGEPSQSWNTAIWGWIIGRNEHPIAPISVRNPGSQAFLQPSLSKPSIFLSPNLEPFCILRKFIKDGASGQGDHGIPHGGYCNTSSDGPWHRKRHMACSRLHHTSPLFRQNAELTTWYRRPSLLAADFMELSWSAGRFLMPRWLHQMFF